MIEEYFSDERSRKKSRASNQNCADDTDCHGDRSRLLRILAAPHDRSPHTALRDRLEKGENGKARGY